MQITLLPVELDACLHTQGGTVLLAVKVQPRASKNELGPLLGGELKVKVTAPPVDSKANDALLHLLAQTLNIPRSSLQLAKGQTSRHKLVRIVGLTLDETSNRLRLAFRNPDA